MVSSTYAFWSGQVFTVTRGPVNQSTDSSCHHIHQHVGVGVSCPGTSPSCLRHSAHFPRTRLAPETKNVTITTDSVMKQHSQIKAARRVSQVNTRRRTSNTTLPPLGDVRTGSTAHQFKPCHLFSFTLKDKYEEQSIFQGLQILKINTKRGRG